MGNRVLRWIYLLDMVSLAIAIGVASLYVFGTVFPWMASTPASMWPFLALLLAGGTAGSYMSARAWGKTAPRPTYGRAVAIIGFASAFTALGLVLTRVYWSRTMFAITIAVWLGLALTDRAVLRRRPWSERMVIVTGEKQLAEDIRGTRHADVLAVFDAGGGATGRAAEPGRLDRGRFAIGAVRIDGSVRVFCQYCRVPGPVAV